MMADDAENALQNVEGKSPLPPALAERPSKGRATLSILHAFASRFLRGIALTTIAVAILAEGPAFYFNVAQLIGARAAAANAAQLRHAEAITALQRANKEREVARNAKDRLQAEAEQMAAEADKLQQDAVSKRNEALNVQNKAKADADAMVAKAELTRQEALSELAKAQVAALAMKTEADQAEQNRNGVRYALRANVYQAGLMPCPGTTYIAKINAGVERNGRCE